MTNSQDSTAFFSPYIALTYKQRGSLLTRRPSIRPLLTAEVRTRTLTGRTQISEAGQHLVDGTPFGRPCLRPRARPAVRIPPRKRQRLVDARDPQQPQQPQDHDDDTQLVDDESRTPRLITATGEGEHDENMLNGSTNSISAPKATKSVSFDALPCADAHSDSDDDDDDFAPGGDSGQDDSSTQDTSDTDSDSESSTASASDSPSKASDTGSSASDSSSDTDSDSSSSEGEPDEIRGGNPVAHSPVRDRVPPGKGHKLTQIRNKRRNNARKIKRLIAYGKLPPGATTHDLRMHDINTTAQETKDDANATSSKKRKLLDEDTSADMGAMVKGQAATELEQRKRHLMERVGRLTTATELQPAAPSPSAAENPHPRKRIRPDLAAFGRIVKHQATNPPKKSRKTSASSAETNSAPPDPDLWKSRINLSAFECWHEDYELSAPPFPFKQHWDPASEQMREKAAQKKGKKKANKPNQREEQPEDNEASIVLDYGDENGVTEADGDASAAIEAQLLLDVSTAATQPDLPPIPDDVDALPSLEQSDIKKGAIIIFKEFQMRPGTIMPEISPYKTAVVEDEGDSGNGAGSIGIRLADRDRIRNEKKYDRKGNLVMSNADKFAVSDEDEDDGWRGVMFGELLEAKLLPVAGEPAADS